MQLGQNGTSGSYNFSSPARDTLSNSSSHFSTSLLCLSAVHGVMAGFTGFSVGLCNNRMVFLPIPELVATSPRSMNPTGRTWERILAITRQPNTVNPSS